MAAPLPVPPTPESPGARALARQLAEQAPGVTLAVGPEGTVLLATGACEAALGRPAGACAGLPLAAALGVGGEADALADRVRRVFEGERFARVPLPAPGPHGAARRLLAHFYPVRDATGAVAACAVAIPDATPATAPGSEPAAHAADPERTAGPEEQHPVLVGLAKEVSGPWTSRRALLARITEAAADALDVDRVNVWAFGGDGGAIECLDCFARATGEHVVLKETLSADEAPRYFATLERQRLVATRDVAEDGRTRELKGPYLDRHGITSLLDAPVRVGGRLVGAVCHEHVGRRRAWTEADKAFAASVADLVALSLETHRLREAEAKREAEAEREAAEHERTLLLEFQNRILVRLARRALAEGETPQTLARHVTEVVTEALDVDGATVWLAGDGTTLTCVDRYRRSSGTHEAGEQLPYAEGSAALGASEDGRFLAFTDVRTDARFDEPTRTDILARGAEAYLSVRIQQGDVPLGLVTAVHAGGPRRWTPEERGFLAAVADFVALGIETLRRREAERTLRTREAFLVRVLDTSPSPSFVKDREGRFVLVNAPFAALYGLTPADIIGRRNEDFVADRGAIATYSERDDWVFETGQPVLLPDDPQRMPDGVTRWFQTRLVPISVGGEAQYILGVATDVTPRRAREEALITATRRAEEASRLKSTLLANMSHEIRTPLTAIIGFSEVLADLRAHDPEVGEIAALVRTSGQRLLDTLNSVLDLAQLEGGARELRPEPLDLAEEVRLTAALFEPNARGRGLALEVRLPDGPTPARMDRLALGRVLTNLVSNALKFTPQGAVRVGLELEPDAATLTVADTGVGISEAFLPHLFDEFKQESEGYGRHHEGSGLGMAITRRLVELMGGTIAVESRKGAGTTFTVRLPREP